MIVKESLLSLLFPPLCLSCESLLGKEDRKLCDECASLLELIDPDECCPRCFSLLHSKTCSFCLQNYHPFSGMAAAFEHCGPPAILVKKMKCGGLSYLAKILAACLITQLDRLDWPEFDLIIPVPLSFDRQLQRGFNQSALLGSELSQMLGVPMKEILSRPIGEYSQEGLSHKKRRKQNPQFFLKKGVSIPDRTVLLIDDVVTTGQTLRQCAHALLEGFPHKIYGLTICRAGS